MATNDAQLTIGVDASALTAGMRQAATAVREGAEQMKGHLESVTGIFEKLNLGGRIWDFAYASA